MDLIKWYVYFTGRGGLWRCHCFEDDEKQARHFASLVNGQVELEINGRKIELEKSKK